MKLFDNLVKAIFGFQPPKEPDSRQNPPEDKPSKANGGPRKMEPRPYYRGEPGENPPSKPASRPHSPTASRQSSARTPSARTPSATESHQPSAITPSARTSRRRSVSPPSKIASPRKKGIFEVTEQYIRSKNKKIHETPTIGEINKEFYDLVQTMRDLKKIEEIIARYKKEGEDNKLFGIELPPEITYDGYEIKKEDLKNESRYFYITKGKLEPLYQLLNDNGITEFNLRERRDSYGKATMKEEENNMRNKKNGLSKNSGGGRGP
jgi:hypothetical protein